jgi:hypothetical protein
MSKFRIRRMPLSTREPVPPFENTAGRGSSGGEGSRYEYGEHAIVRNDRNEQIAETGVLSQHDLASSHGTRHRASVVPVTFDFDPVLDLEPGDVGYAMDSSPPSAIEE